MKILSFTGATNVVEENVHCADFPQRFLKAYNKVSNCAVSKTFEKMKNASFLKPIIRQSTEVAAKIQWSVQIRRKYKCSCGKYIYYRCDKYSDTVSICRKSTYVFQR